MVTAFWLLPAIALAGDPGVRAFTAADSIEMTHLGDAEYWHHNQSLGRVAHYSPDGTKMVMVLRRGNLAEGTTEYSLLLYNSAELLRTPPPEPLVLLRMSSSSNSEIFESLTWLGDNRTLLFLGERPGETRQVFRFDVATRALEQITHSATTVLSYSASADGASVLYLAEKPQTDLWNRETRRNGIVVSGHHLTDLITGRQLPVVNRGDLYIQSSGQATQIRLKHAIDGGFIPTLSPDGRHALVRVYSKSVPPKWQDYTDTILRSSFPDGLAELQIVDLRTGEARRFLEAPQLITHGGVYAKWAPDGSSVLMTLVFLPLDGVNAQERQRRLPGPFTAEIDMTGQVRPLAPASLLEMDRIESWDRAKNIATLIRESPQGMQRTFFRMQSNRWREITAPGSWRSPVDVSLKEGMNVPPRIVVFDPGAKRVHTLLDLNPQLKGLTLARQEEIEWKATDGTRVRGGLYHPPGYVQGRRYPLVIQTHGFNPRLFAADGVFFSPFAAQALANKGMFVLQAWDFPQKDNEASWQRYLETKINRVPMHQLEQSIYEGAIDHLDAAGLIDRNKVGVIGFSYTCWSVKYILSHPREGYRYAAAAVADGFDGGYFDYIVNGNQAILAQQFEVSAGGKPYGQGLQAWLKESPGFNIDEVDTPLRMLPQGNPQALMHDWEWFILLRRMEKPVELVVIEDGTHTLVKPWDRMVASGGNVDWFDFWLNGRKDERWEKMRYKN